MICRDEFSAADCEVYGTDFSTSALARARAGIYSQLEVNRGLPARKLVAHFRKRVGEDSRWQLSDALRKSVHFRMVNLIDHWPVPVPMDIVLLRNVLVYFSEEWRHRVLERMRGALAPGGFLILGATETNVVLPGAFKRVEKDRAVCFQLMGG